MFVSPEVLSREPVTHIVSLGWRCAVAHHLRRYYNFGGAFPFDWWISSASGVVKFLEAPDVDALYDTTKLALTAKSASVRHSDFDFLLHHEFKRDWKDPAQPVVDGWAADIATPRSRTSALVRKFLALNDPGNRIAFIREARTEAGEAEALTAMQERLATLFPNATWSLLSLDRVPDDGGKFGWKGSTERWDKALSGLNLKLDRTNHTDFIEKSHAPGAD